MFGNPFLEKEAPVSPVSVAEGREDMHLDAGALFGSEPEVEAVAPPLPAPEVGLDASSLFGESIDFGAPTPSVLSPDEERPGNEEALDWEEEFSEPTPTSAGEQVAVTPTPRTRKFPLPGKRVPTPDPLKIIAANTPEEEEETVPEAADLPTPEPEQQVPADDEWQEVTEEEFYEEQETGTLPPPKTLPKSEQEVRDWEEVSEEEEEEAEQQEVSEDWEEVSEEWEEGEQQEVSEDWEEEPEQETPEQLEEEIEPVTKKTVKPRAKRHPVVGKVRVKMEERPKTSRYDDGKSLVEIQDRDVEIFEFLARHRFAKWEQLARHTLSSLKSIRKRAHYLEKAGFLNSSKRGGHTIIFSKKAAMDWIQEDMTPLSPSDIKVSSLPHELGVAIIAASLSSYETNPALAEQYKIEQFNILKEEGFPFSNRYASDDDTREGRLLGENCVTSREIRSLARKMEIDNGGRAGAMAERKKRLDAWTPGERSPETLRENAGLFMMWNQNHTDHPIDLVIARDRNDDGSPESIAIELELSPKTGETWEKILKNYSEYINAGLLKQVIYFASRKGIVEGLKKAQKKVGLRDDQLRILKYTPTRANGADEDPEHWQDK